MLSASLNKTFSLSNKKGLTPNSRFIFVLGVVKHSFIIFNYLIHSLIFSADKSAVGLPPVQVGVPRIGIGVPCTDFKHHDAVANKIHCVKPDPQQAVQE